MKMKGFRFWISGPRIFGLRTGISFRPEFNSQPRKSSPTLWFWAAVVWALFFVVLFGGHSPG